jgi:hypothetical protein
MKLGFKYVKPSEGCGFVLIVCITNDKFIMKFVYWRWPRSWAMVGGEIRRPRTWPMVAIIGVWRWLLCKEFQRTNWINILASIFPQSDVLGKAAAPPRVIMHVCCNDGRRTLFLPRYLASKRSGDFRAVQGKWRVTPDENALSVHTKSTQIPLVIKRMRESCPCDPEC